MPRSEILSQFFQLSQIFFDLRRLLRISSPAAAPHQKHGEVGGERLMGKLPHH
jgi:hypothetical protein